MNTSKTLLAILVEYLPENGGWPHATTSIGQDWDRELMFYGRGCVRTGIILDDLAIDHRKRFDTGVKITREQYEAALAASKEPLTGTGVDGWIDWPGGECPVNGVVIVDYKMRDGCVQTEPAHILRWDHNGTDSDIIAYRLSQPQDANSRANDDRLEADLNDCIGQAPAEEWKPYVNAEIEWNEGRRWFPGTVTAITDEWIIIKDKRGNEGSYLRDVLSIRPIDFECNDMAKIIKTAAEKYHGLVNLHKFIADELYAAGYRKQ